MRFSTASKTFSSFSWKEMTQFWAATMEICWPRGVSSSTPMRTARAMASSLSPCSSNFGREVAVRMSSWASIGMSKKAPTMWTICGSVMPRTWIQTIPGLPAWRPTASRSENSSTLQLDSSYEMTRNLVGTVDSKGEAAGSWPGARPISVSS